MQRLPVGQTRDWKGWFWCGLSGGLAVLLWLAGGFLAAQAVTPSLCVNLTGAGGCYTTIQDAVNAATTGATINIASGTYNNGTVTVTGKNLSFVGAGTDQTFIDGNHTSRVFFTSSSAKIELSNLTVQNGYVENANGAGIYGVSALTLTNVAVMSNTAVFTSYGGGLYVQGALFLNNTRFVSNTAATGGGFYALATTNVTDSHFEHNTAFTTGGGLHIQQASTLAVTATDFISNTAQVGGGVYSSNKIVMQDVTFENNYAVQAAGLSASGVGFSAVLTNTDFFSNTTTNVYGGASIQGYAEISGGRYQGNSCGGTCYGGGLQVNTGTVSGTLFIGNTSTSGGGGLGVTSTSATPIVTVTNSYFERNVCTNSDCKGGGMHANAAVALVDTDFYSNTGGTGSFGGGGLYAIPGATITGGQFRYNTGFNGGALSSGVGYSTTFVISGTQFISNTASITGTGGGAFYSNPNTGSSALLVNVYAAGNSAKAGGAVFVGRAITVTGSVFEHNSALDGGALSAGTNSSVSFVISDTQFLGNTGSLTGTGGALYFNPGANSSALLANVYAAGNSASKGGAVYSERTMTVTGSVFESNSALDGGALGEAGTNAVKLVISGTRFVSNTGAITGTGGGAIYFTSSGTGSSAILTNVYAENNSAKAGGAIYAAKSITITGSNIENNHAMGGPGGGLNASDAMTVTGSEFANNTASGNGGAIYQLNNAGRIVNSLFAGNWATGYGDGYFRSNLGGPIRILNTTFATPTVPGGDAIYVVFGTVQITNTLVASYTTGIHNVSGTVTQDYNLFTGVITQTSGTVGGGTHSLSSTNARFVDPDNGNYRLLTGSPAAGKGTNLGVLVDLDGNTRADPPSIGAYEGTAAPGGLSLVKAVSPTAAVPFQGTAVYTLTLANGSAQSDPNAMITDTLPGGVTFQNWIQQPPGAVRSGSAITWTGTLANAAQVTLVFAATNTASGGVTITNTAGYSGTGNAGTAVVAYTTAADCYAASSGNWSVVFAACAPGTKRIIPPGIVVTLDVDVTLTGDFEVQSGATFTANGKTMTLAGGAAQTLTGSPLTFYKLVLTKDNKTDTVRIVGKLLVTKKLTITKGSLISASEYGDLEIEAQGELTLTNPISITGSFTNSGDLNTEGHAVNFTGGLVAPAQQNLVLNVMTWFDDLNVMTGTMLIETVTDDNALVLGTLQNYGTIRKTQPIEAAAPYYFGLAGSYGDASLEVDAAVVGSLSALQVDRIDASPANAPGATPLYWQITPLGGGYAVTLTLPHHGLANPYACRRMVGSQWDCMRASFDGTTVVRHNVTEFSDWGVFAAQPTTTTVTGGPNPSVSGQELVVTATVSALPPGSGTPTGIVTFTADGANIGTSVLDGGVATYTTGALTAGTHAIAATYRGDDNNAGSSSQPYSQVVQPLPLAVNDAAGTLQDTAITVSVLANDRDLAGGGLTVAAITLQPANGSALPTGDGSAVIYTPNPGFSGLDTFMYVAQDANGNSDDAMAAIVVAPKSQVGEPPQIAPVNPQVEITTPFTGTTAQTEVQLPAGFVTNTLEEKEILFLSYTPAMTPTQETTSPPANLKFGNFEFDLTLFLDNEPQHGVQFAVPITVTIAYDPSIVEGLKEETLSVYYWDGTAWITSGITVINRDLVNHTITIALTHLSQFGFFAQKTPTGLDPIDEPTMNTKLYLPGVLREVTAAGTAEQAIDQAVELPVELPVEQAPAQAADLDTAKQIYLPLLNK